MRIAQVAPLFEAVPPKLYGGTERVVSYLTEELVRQGHEVTLFASGDSVTAAELVPICPQALRLDAASVDRMAPHFPLLEQVARAAHRFDVIHYHIDYLHYPLSRRLGKPQLTTLHGRLDLPDLEPLYREYRDMPLVSISDAQRRPLPWANWQGTVYHGLPPNLYHYQDGGGGYLAFLGRISPEKRVDRAIRIAQAVGMKLRVAAKVDRADQEYYREKIEPLFLRNKDRVEFLGEVGGAAKQEFLGNAAALLFPIDWPEPFGLVMIEALACGTPVIAYGGGSVPEILEHGLTGFIVNDQQRAIAAARNIDRIDRQRCREAFEQRFTATVMAENYVDVYRKLQGTDVT